MIRQPITFEKVATQEQFNALREFAASFDHKIEDTTLRPLITLARGDKVFGYYSVATTPIYFPAFHPSKTTPRDFRDAIEQVRASAWLQTAGHPQYPKGVMLSAFSNPSFSREIIRKAGFRSTKCELFESFPEMLNEDTPLFAPC